MSSVPADWSGLGAWLSLNEHCQEILSMNPNYPSQSGRSFPTRLRKTFRRRKEDGIYAVESYLKNQKVVYCRNPADMTDQDRNVIRRSLSWALQGHVSRTRRSALPLVCGHGKKLWYSLKLFNFTFQKSAAGGLLRPVIPIGVIEQLEKR